MQIGVDSQRAVENRRIYVIDDDEITRAALQFMLHDEYETHEFGTLAAADKASAWPPDLVLLGGGLLAADAAYAARLKTQLTTAKVLLVCDAAQERTARARSIEGIDGYIIKPLRMESVRGRVDNALGRQRTLSIPVAHG